MDIMKSRKTVLVVDDEEDLTWSISRSLKRENKSVEVICLNSGSDALALLRRGGVDLLVTDLRMPDVGGFDLIRFVHDQRLKTRIIVMTAYGSSDLQHQILVTDGCQYIEKPFEIAWLKEKIYSLLEEDISDKAEVDVNRQIERLLSMTKPIENLRISVFHGDRTGRLFLSNGEIYRAELDKKRGKDALQEILAWKNCLLKAETLLTSPHYSLLS